MAVGLMKVSVEAHQMVIRRLARLDFLKSRMSWRSCSARSSLFFPCLHVRPVDLLDVVVIEHRLHGRDGAEPALHFVEEVAFEHASFAGGRVHVVFENIPAGEDQIVEPGERNELLDFGRPAVGALSQTDGSHLGERADGVRDSLAHRFDARNKRRRDRAHAGDHYAQLALGRLDRVAGGAVGLVGGLQLDAT